MASNLDPPGIPITFVRCKLIGPAFVTYLMYVHQCSSTCRQMSSKFENILSILRQTCCQYFKGIHGHPLWIWVLIPWTCWKNNTKRMTTDLSISYHRFVLSIIGSLFLHLSRWVVYSATCSGNSEGYVWRCLRISRAICWRYFGVVLECSSCISYCKSDPYET